LPAKPFVKFVPFVVADWEWVVENGRLVIDTRNATRGLSPNPANVVKL